MRVGSCGVKDGRGGAWTLFQGRGCCAKAKAVNNNTHDASASNRAARTPIRVILSGAPALLLRLASFARRAGAQSKDLLFSRGARMRALIAPLPYRPARLPAQPPASRSLQSSGSYPETPGSTPPEC